MSKLPIRRLDLPHHDSKAVNLETVLGGRTLKKMCETYVGKLTRTGSPPSREGGEVVSG